MERTNHRRIECEWAIAVTRFMLPAVLAMADRVSYRPADKAATGRGGSADVSSTSVEVTTRDGRRFEHRSTGVPGDPKNPVSWDQIEAKFRDCVSFSAKPVSPGNVDKAAGLIRNLDDLDDVSTLIRLLS